VASAAVFSGGAVEYEMGGVDLQNYVRVVQLMMELEQEFGGCDYAAEYVYSWEDWLGSDEGYSDDYTALLLAYYRQNEFCFSSLDFEHYWKETMLWMVQNSLHHCDGNQVKLNGDLVEEAGLLLDGEHYGGADRFAVAYILAEELVCSGNFDAAFSAYARALAFATDSSDVIQMREDLYLLCLSRSGPSISTSEEYWNNAGEELSYEVLLTDVDTVGGVHLVSPVNSFPFMQLMIEGESRLIILKPGMGWYSYPLLPAENVLSLTHDNYGGCFPFRRKGVLEELDFFVQDDLYVAEWKYREDHFLCTVAGIDAGSLLAAGFVQESESSTGHTQDLRYETFFTWVKGE